MASAAPLARSDDRSPTVDASLYGDAIGYDAWLLPPAAPRAAERAIQFASSIAGPIVFASALVGMVRWLV